jgi:hypothetical protein
MRNSQPTQSSILIALAMPVSFFPLITWDTQGCETSSSRARLVCDQPRCRMIN